MVFQYTPHTVPLSVATVIAAIGAIVAWRRRRGQLEVWGTIVQFTVMLWALSMLLLVSVESLELKRALVHVYFPIAVVCPMTFFVFTVHFIGRSDWLTRLRIAGLASLPVLSVIVTWTNPIHNRVFSEFTLLTGGAYLEVSYSFELGFYLLFGLTYCFCIGFLVLLFQKFRRSRNVYRKMSLVLFVSLAILITGPLISALGYSPFPHLLLFPYTYAVIGVVLVLGTSSARFLRLLPVDSLLSRITMGSQRTMATARDVVVQEIDNGIIILDRDGVVVDINSTARKMIGADRPVGKPLNEVAPHEQITTESPVRSILEQGKELQELTDELWVETPRGERCYEVRVTGLVDSSGRDAGHVVLLHDITDRKRREETLREREAELERQKTDLETQKAQLEHQNERLDQFASIVSHDLRNPLNVAKGRLQIVNNALDDLESTPVDPEHGEKVAKSLDRMEAIIDDALTLARQGKAITETQTISLRDTVQTAWENVETKEATLDPCEEIQVESDRNRLLNVFENLFRNALEHGREDVTIRVGLLEDGFFVEDDGPGIDDEDKDEVFEQGFTTSREGTGFGLAIVRDVVRAHGWKVSVTDSPDGGARFEITGVEFS
jgi:PAS domain S-box-containing protein